MLRVQREPAKIFHAACAAPKLNGLGDSRLDPKAVISRPPHHAVLCPRPHYDPFTIHLHPGRRS